MRRASLLLVTAASFAAPALAEVDGDSVRFVDLSIELPDQRTSELLGVQFVDLDGDGREEAVLAVRVAAGRELRLHRLDPSNPSSEPYRIVPVLDDAIAYGVADVREEAGREVLLLTKKGAWSFSPVRDGLRGNFQRFVELDLLFDVADPRALPAWRHVMRRPGRDWVLLPGVTRYHVLVPEVGPRAEGESAAYAPLAGFVPEEVAQAFETGDRVRTTVSVSDGGLAFSSGTRGSLGPPFLPDDEAGTGTFLRTRVGYYAPALVDVDGDGLVDIVERTHDGIAIRLGGDTLSDRPDRTEAFPAYVLEDSEFEFADFEGDGDMDVIVRHREDQDGLESEIETLTFLVNDGSRLFPEAPHQEMRFDNMELRTQIADVDGDGRADLSVRKFDMPGLLDAVTGLEFEMTYLLFLGDDGARPFERKAVLKQTTTFDESTFQEAIQNRDWSRDCSGDGIADVVEIDIEGRIAIRRLQRTSHLFGSDTWELERTPWVRFETRGNLEELEVRDVNGDGLGDVVSRDERRLTILVSSRGRGR